VYIVQKTIPLRSKLLKRFFESIVVQARASYLRHSFDSRTTPVACRGLNLDRIDNAPYALTRLKAIPRLPLGSFCRRRAWRWRPSSIVRFQSSIFLDGILDWRRREVRCIFLMVNLRRLDAADEEVVGKRSSGIGGVCIRIRSVGLLSLGAAGSHVRLGGCCICAGREWMC
jgi:hypothetical protein